MSVRMRGTQSESERLDAIEERLLVLEDYNKKVKLHLRREAFIEDPPSYILAKEERWFGPYQRREFKTLQGDSLAGIVAPFTSDGYAKVPESSLRYFEIEEGLWQLELDELQPEAKNEQA